MRIWSIHPKYLDRQGIVALWRETLLAQAVLLNQTNGYRNHPQLDRFKQSNDPSSVISHYLLEIHRESIRRGYSFDQSKIQPPCSFYKLSVSTEQINYEWQHLLAKLKVRSPDVYSVVKNEKRIDIHPLFTVYEGPVEHWEKV